MSITYPLDSDETGPSTSTPILTHRRPIHLHRPPRSQPSSTNRRGQATNGSSDLRLRASKNAVGGSLVNSMKRGIKPRPISFWSIHRTAILLSVAITLLVALNIVWWIRVDTRVRTRGGWNNILGLASSSTPSWVAMDDL